MNWASNKHFKVIPAYYSLNKKMQSQSDFSFKMHLPHSSNLGSFFDLMKILLRDPKRANFTSHCLWDISSPHEQTCGKSRGHPWSRGTQGSTCQRWKTTQSSSPPSLEGSHLTWGTETGPRKTTLHLHYHWPRCRVLVDWGWTKLNQECAVEQEEKNLRNKTTWAAFITG